MFGKLSNFFEKMCDIPVRDDMIERKPMNKKRKLLIIIGILLLLLVVGILVCYIFSRHIIQPVRYESYSDQLVYEKELFERKAMGQDDITFFFEKIEILSKYINKNYPNTQWYISYFNRDHLFEERAFISCYEITDNIYMANNHITFEVGRENVTDEIIYSTFLVDKSNVPSGNFIGDWMLNEIVRKEAKSYYGLTPFSGKYQMVFTADNKLVYEVRINEFSVIQVDAFTGEIVKEHFWDGVIVD